jgi:hypothetical protein
MKGGTLRKFFLLAATGTMLVALLTSPVHASPPTEVVIVSPFNIASGTGSFEVTEDDGDVLCDEGSVENLFPQENLFAQIEAQRSPSHAQFQAAHVFTCEDGSGSFVLFLRVTQDLNTLNTTGSWTVRSRFGTDDYAKLHGTGSFVGIRCGPDCVLDTYTGRVHLD